MFLVFVLSYLESSSLSTTCSACSIYVIRSAAQAVRERAVQLDAERVALAAELEGRGEGRSDAAMEAELQKKCVGWLQDNDYFYDIGSTGHFYGPSGCAMATRMKSLFVGIWVPTRPHMARTYTRHCIPQCHHNSLAAFWIHHPG